ncbi:MAG: hypothetical protein U1E60_14900 [Reyranellaceae bacterium]
MREIPLDEPASDAIRRHQPFVAPVCRVEYAPERVGLTWIDPADGHHRPLTGDNPLYLSGAFMQERWLPGTPVAIADKIVAWQPRLELDHLIFQPRPPACPCARPPTSASCRPGR